MVMLMTTLSAGAFGGGVASGKRASDSLANDAGRAWPEPHWRWLPFWDSATTTIMLLFGRALFSSAILNALEAAILYSN